MPLDRLPLNNGDILDFGEFRLKKRGSRYSQTGCAHKDIVIDPDEGTLECQDCGASIDPFSKLVKIAERQKALQWHRKRERERLGELWRAVRNYRPHLRAAKALEQIWRGGKLAPNCPHCNAALLPEDCTGGLSSRSAEIERQRRKAKQ